jgi:hypothetical protein
VKQYRKSTLNRRVTTDEINLTKLILLAGELGYSVAFKDNESIKGYWGFVSFKKATITIYDNLLIDEKIYILLHEIGHIYAEEPTINPLYFLQETIKNKKIKSKKKVSSITEEVLAWYYGVLIADLLGIKVRKKINKCLVKSLDSHISFHNGKNNARTKDR